MSNFYPGLGGFQRSSNEPRPLAKIGEMCSMPAPLHLTSKRFGGRDWFVIEHRDDGRQPLADETTDELHAPLVIPVLIVADNEEHRDSIVGALTVLVDEMRGALDTGVFETGELRVDSNACRATVSGRDVVLTRLEFRLLAMLVERRECVVTRSTLLAEVWAVNAKSKTRTIDTHVKRVRDKLGTAGRFIQCVRGLGYRFSETPLPRGGRARGARAA